MPDNEYRAFRITTVDELQDGDVFAYDANNDFDDIDFESNADWIKLHSTEPDEDGDDDTVLGDVTYLHQNWRTKDRLIFTDTVAVHENPALFEDNE